MSDSLRNGIRSILRFPLVVYRGFRSLVLNALFILLLLTIIIVLVGNEPLEPIRADSTLILDPKGRIVEQRELTDPVTLLLSGNAPDELGQVVLQDLLDVIHTAAEDDNIKAMLLQPGSLAAASFSHLREVGTALQRFRATGKPIYARAGSYTQGQYYLASHADQIMLNPFGVVGIEGLSTWQLYFSEALDKLGVNAHIFRVGEYKAAVEPYERNDMSEQARANNIRLLGGLWEAYVQDISKQRALEPAHINELLNNFDVHLAASDGDTAAFALANGLVDRVEPAAESTTWLKQTLDGTYAQDEDLRSVSYQRYLTSLPPMSPGLPPSTEPSEAANEIGIIIASGEIAQGEGQPGVIGSKSLIELIREAKDDANLQALVLRVDSPGGSAYASEQIRNELVAFRNTGRPLIVSMGPVAASGGYWIATPANQIWASPVTITGSIGIFSILPTFEETFAKLGLNSDGVGTTALAGAGALGQELSPMVQRVVQSSTEFGYRRFLTLVAEAREMTEAEVDTIAQGQVWSGEEALNIGLIDGLGELTDAVAVAAELAGIEEYDTTLLRHRPSPAEEFVQQFIEEINIQFRPPLPAVYHPLHPSHPLQQQLQQFQNLATLPLRLNDPNDLYLHCLGCSAMRL
ncbi:MAG: signal peptide peptidase SppA [Pseudohongiellaceae bacterium]